MTTAPVSYTAAKLLGELDKRVEQLAIVNGVLRAVSGGAGFADILRVFASNLKKLCPFDRCSIALYDDQERLFHIPYAAIGNRFGESGESSRSPESSPLGEVLRTRQPILRRHIEAEERRFDSDTDLAKMGLHAEVLLPLQVGPRFLGALHLATYETDRLDEDHVRLIQDLLPAVSVALWIRSAKERAF
ncbi:MAG: GAF domain-containing protein [Planctomycetes bacterium]|nr:GAF domain-containing protein [Planctomycetota bacterium]